MKKYLIIIAFFVSCSVYPQQPAYQPASLDTLWMNVGNPMFSAARADFTSLAFSPSGQPYIAFEDGGHSDKATVMKFDGTAWVNVGTPGFSPGTALYTGLAFSPAGEPYVVFWDYSAIRKVMVMKFNGTSWVNVGPAGFSAGDGDYPSLAFSLTGQPYVAFMDFVHPYKATVMKFNGSTWDIVGTPGFSVEDAWYINIRFSPSNEPYVAFGNVEKASVMKFNGTNWVYIGTPGFSAGGAPCMSLAFNAAGQPHVSYCDGGNGQRTTVMKYDGSAWVNVGNPGFSAGHTGWQSLAFGPNDEPYVAFQDSINSTKATVMRFHGGNWINVGIPGFSAGQADYTSLAFSPSGKPYVGYMDQMWYATVMKFDTVCFTGPAGPITGPLQVCKGSSGYVYTVPTVSGATNYTWSVPFGASITSGIGTNSIIVSFGTNAVSGNISVFATAHCNGASAQLLVNVNSLPVPTITGPGSVCAGSTGVIYSTEAGMSGYTWTITAGGIITAGPGTNSVTVTWNTAGLQTLSVNYTDINGCTAATAGSFPVSVTPLPDSAGNITGVTPVCAGALGITYSVAAIPDASSYSWTVPLGVNIVAGQNTNSILVNIDQGAISGDFTVYGINSCGNSLPSPPFHLIVNRTAEATAGPDTTACEGSSVTILHSSVADQVHLHWTTTGQGTFSNDTLIHPVYIPSVSDTGDVTLSLKAFSAAPCPDDSSSMIIHYHHPPLVSAGPGQTVCGPTPVTMSGSAAIHCSSFSWTTTGSGTFNDPDLLHPMYTPSAADLVAGQVILSITGLGPPCTPDTDSMQLILQKTAAVDAGPDDSICEGDTCLLNFAIAGNYSSLLWATSGSGTFNDASILNPVYTPGVSDISNGSAKLTLLAASFSPCPAVSDSVMIYIDRKPSCNAGPDMDVCPGGSVTITGATAMNYSNERWTTNGNGQLSGETGLGPGYTPGPDESGEITLTLQVSGTGKCISSTAFDQMKVLIQSAVHIQTRKADTIPYNTTDTLAASVTGGSGEYQYSWEPGSLLVDDTVPGPVTVNLTSDTLFILFVKDRITGCTATDSIYVRLLIPETIHECLLVHNVITPNGDGLNDCWVIDCIENYPVNKVDVFNIWGDVINSYSGYNNTMKIWCGENTNNQTVPDGTYYYVIKIPDHETLTGWILVRAGTK